MGRARQPVRHPRDDARAVESGIAPYFADRWTVFRDLVVDSHRIPWISLVAAVPYVLLFALFPRLEARQFARLAEILLVWAIGWGGVALAGHLASRSPVWHLQSANGLFAVSPWLILSGLGTRDPARPGVTRSRRATDRARSATRSGSRRRSGSSSLSTSGSTRWRRQCCMSRASTGGHGCSCRFPRCSGRSREPLPAGYWRCARELLADARRFSWEWPSRCPSLSSSTGCACWQERSSSRRSFPTRCWRGRKRTSSRHRGWCPRSWRHFH